MPAPVNEAGPSQGGREGILKLEDNIHHKLGLNTIYVTPFPWISPYAWYRNLTTWNNKPSTTMGDGFYAFFKWVSRSQSNAASPLLIIGESCSLPPSQRQGGPWILPSPIQECKRAK
jgi:hypothetical protein